MNYQTLGTCSICGGPVTVPTVFGSIIPPTPTCMQCGAVAAAHGPIIPMRYNDKGVNVFIEFTDRTKS